MKTYLTLWFSSEGSGPVEIVERLRSLGFEPLRGYHDHVYDWKRNVDIGDILQLTDKIHHTLKGLNVLTRSRQNKPKTDSHNDRQRKIST